MKGSPAEWVALFNAECERLENERSDRDTAKVQLQRFWVDANSYDVPYTEAAEEIKAFLRRLYPPELVVDAADEFVTLEFPPRLYLLQPIVQEKNLVMKYGPRGIGKTLASLGMALAAATPGKFLKWTGQYEAPVLYIDGELPQEVLQRRLVDVSNSTGMKIPKWFHLITPDRQPERRLPNLAEAAGQEIFSRVIDAYEPKLIFLDNLSTLVRSGEENDASSWQSIQDWLVWQRSRGRTVVLDHHSGKSGDQRGTSKREDVLDVVIKLVHPAGYNPKDGARFEVHLTKARDVRGEAAEAFEARLEGNAWTVKPLEQAKADLVRSLQRQGLSAKEIEKETGISYSYALRVIKKDQQMDLGEDQARGVTR
jgi:putative DNA primase/helicase